MPGLSSNAAGPAILCVHPSYELYGADRTFIQAIHAFRARWPYARLTIVLPGEGPLADVLRATEPNVLIEDLLVLRRADLAATFSRLPGLLARTLRARRLMAEHDLVYINTSVLLDYLLASRFVGSACLIHVHELPSGLARSIIARILSFSRGDIAFISEAVRSAFPELLSRRTSVIWNGTRDFAAEPICEHALPIRLLLIGRFNAWKGQILLLDALAMLSPEQRRNLQIRIVGSAFRGQEYLTDRITAKIKSNALADCVTIYDFDAAPDGHYSWADIVVVPSTRPEPFGLVAIEAMAAGRAVIAAAHGGLVEIVIDGKTGTCFEPSSASALAAAISHYISNISLAAAHGKAGRERFEQAFRQDVYMTLLGEVAANALATTSRTE